MVSGGALLSKRALASPLLLALACPSSALTTKPWPAKDIKTLSLVRALAHGSGAIFCCINSDREKTDVDKKRWVWGHRASGPRIRAS